MIYICEGARQAELSDMDDTGWGIETGIINEVADAIVVHLTHMDQIDSAVLHAY